jgi:hypothetical protein
VAPDYSRQIQRALARQRAAEDSRSKAFDHVAARMPAGALTIGDIADVVGGLLLDQRRELLEHFYRMVKLLELRKHSKDAKEDLRSRNLHRRICVLESELRQMRKGPWR